MNGAPAEALLCLGARSGNIETKEVAQPAKMPGRFRGSLGNDRNVQLPTDSLGDLAGRPPFIGDAMKPRTGGTFFQRKTEESGGVQSMHGGPAVGSVPDIGGDPLFTGDADQCRNEAVIPIAVYRRRQTHQR